MRRTLINLISLVLVLIAFISAGRSVFGMNIAGQSAQLNSQYIALQPPIYLASEDKNILQKQAITNILTRRNSPLVAEVDTFMQVCQEYELNCYLLPSIAGVESGFARAYKPGTYNPFGWGGGLIYFESWTDGITTVGRSLRTRYIDRGAVTLESVGKIYAESPVWSQKVRRFMSEFEYEEQQLELNSEKDAVQL